MIDVEVTLDIANSAISLFENRDVESFLAAEVVIDHPLAGARARGDFVDARAAQALVRELLGRDGDDVAARLLGVVDPRGLVVRGVPAVRARQRRSDIFHGSGKPT
jgi:hypothetical protein